MLEFFLSLLIKLIRYFYFTYVFCPYKYEFIISKQFINRSFSFDFDSITKRILNICKVNILYQNFFVEYSSKEMEIELNDVPIIFKAF